MAEELKTKRTIAKGQFTRSEKRLKDALGNVESTPISTIERRYSELSAKWDILQEIHDAYMTVLTPQATDEENKDSWFDKLADRFDAMELDADRSIDALKLKLASVKMEEAKPLTASSVAVVIEPRSMSSSVQLERIKLEKFNGDIRKYPKFKEQFELYVKPLCTSEQLPFVLKSHLIEEVREEVDNVDDDLGTLWSRLDKRYGNYGKLVDAILSDISKAPKGDGRSTITMINTVERAYRDLSRMGRASEMRNGTIISMIERKLPDEIRFEWVKIVAEKTESDADEKFPLLLELLRSWKAMIEYDQDTIRKPADRKSVSNFATGTPQKHQSGGNTCWIHTSEKHPIWVCQSFKTKSIPDRLAMGKQNNACEACLEIKCSGVADPDKCKKGFKGQVQGCNRPHNKLLHQ